MPEKDVLGKIVDAVNRRLQTTSAASDLAARAREAAARRRDRDLRSLEESLRRRRPAVIAECKKASPSAGLLRGEFDPVELARCYARAGAAAVSVVTEPDFFQGDPGWLRRVREAVPLPVLRKDFIITPRQLEETAVLGADAVLLIQRLLDRDTLAELLEVAAELDLEVLLEIFADEDPEPAVASGARLIGVNARDLATFEVRLDRVAELAGVLPRDRVRVAESGIRGAEDLDRLHRAGYDAFLIGEHLVRAEDPEAALTALRAGSTRSRKAC
ncbi:MAG: indole-3-glycerol phosphate synthase TrpC [bacterium]|nr:indole-3-glycerol phosphate synthase TrpC [bacterium]